MWEANTHQGNSPVPDGLGWGFFPPRTRHCTSPINPNIHRWIPTAKGQNALPLSQASGLDGARPKAMGRAEGRVSFSSPPWMLLLGRTVAIPVGGRRADPFGYAGSDAVRLPHSAAPASCPVVPAGVGAPWMWGVKRSTSIQQSKDVQQPTCPHQTEHGFNYPFNRLKHFKGE